MASDSKTPAIPAWQRSKQPLKSENDVGEEEHAREESSNGEQSREKESTATPGTASKSSDSTGEDASEELSREQVKAFLEDPAVKDEPTDGKRAFLAQKGISNAMIDQELGPEPSPLNVNDFAAFQKDSRPASSPAVAPPRPSAPPIITYPEFLSQAHKPAPLITPTRVLNTTYLASGIAALIYGASTFLVNPMSVSLTEARHDFSTHSLSKLDEFNERLAKLASKMPDAKTSKTDIEADDAESITSDPTELYHRDMGTQTSPPSSRRPSTPGITGQEKPMLEKHSNRLAILQSHLAETLAGIERGEEPAKERQDGINELRHYLDTLMYSTQAINVWGSGGFDGAVQKTRDKEKEDAIDELKKEIRGVKGVLLSARRFAPVSGVARSGA